MLGNLLVFFALQFPLSPDEQKTYFANFGFIPAAFYSQFTQNDRPIDQRETSCRVIVSIRKKDHYGSEIIDLGRLVQSQACSISSRCLRKASMDRGHERLGVFRSDSGITLSFGQATYFISAKDPFHNIALKALEQNDYVPFYIEIAKREGVGPEFRDAMEEMIKDALEDN